VEFERLFSGLSRFRQATESWPLVVSLISNLLKTGHGVRVFTVYLLRVKELPVLGRTIMPVFRPLRQDSPALTLGAVPLSNPSVAVEMRLARIVRDGLDHKSWVIRRIEIV
jgi:hypothetical protein